ncbi:MAG: M20/M25/M40 family metallo-hydrolase [candidate division Zixibacteria bacterium]|nr:M20/M25/M40 family metallo-hydrolase [candidate division Zixibacteria bacterium]
MLLCLIAPSSLFAEISPERILDGISILAHDSLEGRKVGSASEIKAASYIRRQFSSIGLDPAGTNGSWYQPLEFTERIDIGKENSLVVDGQKYILEDDFRPLKNSLNGSFKFDQLVYVGYGIEQDSMEHHDYERKDVEGKAVLIKRFAPDDDPHGPYANHASLDSKIAEALKRGAKGVFFFTPEGEDEDMPALRRRRVSEKDIPIIFLKRTIFNQDRPTPEALAQSEFSGNVDLIRRKNTGINVLGTVKGGKVGADERYVVIGAHFDHLGYGGKGSGSLYAGSDRLIHNGADDNASGTVGVIELARHFKSRQNDLDYSLLFITFTGEESGLLGSNYFVKNPTIDIEKVSLMINMDMIGRLEREEKGLGVFGVGTSPAFSKYFNAYDTLSDFKLNTKKSGIGPSDHTAFYNAGIPVLHFFTGSHQDYHKPSDDIEKIDAEAEAEVLEFIAELVDRFANGKDKLEFSKTKDDAPGASPRFTVTLGVMPDYLTEVKGLRLDGVTEGKPAGIAGLLAGDVIVQMGGYTIDDIYAYMTALSRFRKGDSTSVIVEREGKRIKYPIHFK